MQFLPNYAERKGSLLLRSNHCSFRKGVRSTNWHQMREAEPKDYDITNPNNYNLHKSTYGGFGVTTLEAPVSEMKERMADLHKKEDFEKKQIHKHMLDQTSFKNASWGSPDKCNPVVRHATGHNKMLLDTTNRGDFKPPYNYTPKEIDDIGMKPEMKYRRSHSEFFDRTDHRRWGINTWQDEYRVVKGQDSPSNVIRGTPLNLPHQHIKVGSVGVKYDLNKQRFNKFPSLL